MAEVNFTALDDISSVVFDLNNGLRVISVKDAAGDALSVERFSQDNAIRISLPNPVAKNAGSSLTFNYEGDLFSVDDSPVEGLKVAYIGDDSIYLLYPGRWFPVNNYGTNRFAAKINVAVPPGYTVIGSGKLPKGAFVSLATIASEAPAEAPADETPVLARGKKNVRKPVRHPASTAEPSFSAPGKVVFSFDWEKPSFPGSIIAGHFLETTDSANGANVHVFFNPTHKQFADAYGQTAVKEFEYFSGLYGPALSPTLNVVQLPDDTVPSWWAPEISAIATRAITAKVDYRLLANSIAHQWWGVSISPAAPEDIWLRDGAARYSEARYVENAAGEAGYQEAMKDISVGALAYDNIALASVGKLDPFSPQAQSLATDKGAVIMGMLRWVIGDANYMKTMRQFGFLYGGKAASADDLKKLAEQNYGQPLNWFFTQWLDSTGAPAFTNKYTVFRLGNGKGFRVSGEIKQDLDLFRMPVELRIDTNGKPEVKRI
ncbi:MAG TPA: M1 family aminopeptidase, partial [Terriglobales bacterium]|nr:M1 family aminopeptidase [Terriglobales bacterium]